MPPRSLRILHVTDPHLHAPPGARMRGVSTDPAFVSVVERALLDPDQPDVALATGDLVQDETRAGYERFRHVMSRLQVPVYCLPGNHDAPATMGEVLSASPFQICGLAAHPPWCLVMLNTFAPGDDGGHLSREELTFLDAALASHAESHMLIALHHHPVPMDSQWLDGVALRNPAEFLAVVDRHPNVRGIVWGHVHQASDRLRNGVRLISTPSTCAQFLPGSNSFALDSRPPGFRWLDLHADGTIGTQVVWVE